MLYMRVIGLVFLAVNMFPATSPVRAETVSLEDADLDFLPPSNTGTYGQATGGEKVEKQNFAFKLGNTYQVVDWKDHKKQVFGIPNRRNSDWNNLGQLGMRGELPLGTNITFKTSMLFNAYARQNDEFNISDDLRLDINEAYVSCQISPTLFADTGRINIKNGVANGFNPTDYFKVGSVLVRNTEDISQLRDNRLGALLIRGQKLWDGGSLTLLISPELNNNSNHWFSNKDNVGLNLQKTNDRTRTMLKFTYRISEDFIPEFIYYNESSKHNFGLNISNALNNQWLAYAEWSVGKRRNLIDEALLQARKSSYLDPAVTQQFPDDKGVRYLHQFAIGASYTSVSNINTHFEYHYNGAGLSKIDAERWFEAGSNTRNSPVALAQLLSIRGLAQTRGEPFGKQALFLRSNWTDAGMDDLQLTGLLITDLNDDSSLVQVGAAYQPNDEITLSLRLARFHGERKSNYGSTSYKQTITFQFEYSF